MINKNIFIINNILKIAYYITNLLIKLFFIFKINNKLKKLEYYLFKKIINDINIFKLIIIEILI